MAWVKNHKLSLGVFFIFIFISFLTPITGDDWGNFITGEQGIIASIDNAINMYISWEGRFFSRILINILTYHKWLWNILNSVMITIVFLSGCQLIKKNKSGISYILLFLSILLVNKVFFGQCYLWLAGSITYLFPTALLLGIYIYLFKKKEMKFKKIEFIIFLIFSVLIPMFVENIGCAYLIMLLGFILYDYFFNHHMSKELMIVFVLSAIAFTIMLLSPGSASRIHEYPEFSTLSIFQKIYINIPNFIKYAFTRNPFLLILSCFPVIYMIMNNKYIKGFQSMIATGLILFVGLAVFQNIMVLMPLDVYVNFDFGKLSLDRWYYIIFWFIYGLMFLYSICFIVKDKCKLFKLLLLLFVGLASIGSMLVVPEWGDRVSILFVYSANFISIYLVNEIWHPNHATHKLLQAVLAVLVLSHITLASYGYLFDKRRNKDIQSAIEHQVSELTIYDNPLSLLWHYVPYEEYHKKTFKWYFGLSDEVVIHSTIKPLSECYDYILGKD